MPVENVKRRIPIHVAAAMQNADDPAQLLMSVQKYLQYKLTYALSYEDIIWQKEQTRVLFYPSLRQSSPALFLVPSLINGAEIFDLVPDHSFIKFMTQQGFNIYLLDWGNLPCDANTSFSFCNLEELFQHALDVSRRHAKLKMHLLGYCLGGTILCSFYEAIKAHIKSLTLLAAPIDFSIHEAPWNNLASHETRLDDIISARGMLSHHMMQSYFIHLNHKKTEAKYNRFSRMRSGSLDEMIFVAVEDWLNEGADIPAFLAKDILRRFFYNNELMLLPDNHFDETKQIIIYSQKDQLVPHTSAYPAHKSLQNAYVINGHSGHIGMVASLEAPQKIWQPYATYLHSL